MHNKYYEQTELWNKPPQLYQIRMLSDVLNLIPKDIQSVLDVGCGNGFIINAFPNYLKVVGVDISREALRHVNHVKLVSSVIHLPFEKESFDLVQATDVIEHIPERYYFKALEEIQRIAKRYILIGVPLMENISSGLTKCSACGTVFHLNYHHRSFGITELGELFRIEWTPKLFVFSGETVRLQEIYFRLFRTLFGVFNEGDISICQKCGSKGLRKNNDDKIERSLATLAGYVTPNYASSCPDRSECLVLYEKNQSSFPSQGDEEGFYLVKKKGEYMEVVPTLITKKNGQVIMESVGFAGKNSKDQLWIELKSAGRIYRYPNPTWISSNQLSLPTWFSSAHLKTLSPSRALWTGSKSKEILMMAIQEMVKDLTFRRQLKGMVHTVLERLGMKEV